LFSAAAQPAAFSAWRVTSRLHKRYFVGLEVEIDALFWGFRQPVYSRNLIYMKTFTLTVYAKRRKDGNFEYSLNVWENNGSGSLANEMNFESEALLKQQVDAMLPNGGDVSHILPQVQREGDYWFPFTMPMSDAQAANLGWLAEKPLADSRVH
jgi:hypothetical protein